MQTLARIAGYVWAAPASVVGVLVALLAAGRGARVAVVDGVVEVVGTRLARALAHWAPRSGFHAITLGHVVIGTSPAALAQCRAHEQVHVRQYEYFGVLFFVLYAASSVLEWMRGHDAYWDNHFERHARQRCAPRADPR